MLTYVDEDGNVTFEKPDPTKKVKIKAEDIVLGVPKRSKEEEDPIKKGFVKYFNAEKGYGFITEDITKERVFFHLKQVEGDIGEGDKVMFEIINGPKGLSAINVMVFED